MIKTEAVITHRCRGSLKAGVSIRYGKGWFEGNAWRMWKPITDSEWITTVLTPVAEIQFCPFCGQKLEAEDKEPTLEYGGVNPDRAYILKKTGIHYGYH